MIRRPVNGVWGFNYVTDGTMVPPRIFYEGNPLPINYQQTSASVPEVLVLFYLPLGENYEIEYDGLTPEPFQPLQYGNYANEFDIRIVNLIPNVISNYIP
jgi:hypothetical protein